jgi:hypothetical protein
MNKGLIKIRNISLISLFLLLIIGVVCYFFAPSEFSLAIILSELITFIFFIVTLFFYYKVTRSASPGKSKYVLIVFLGKLIVTGLVFYLVSRFSTINLLTFILSFLVFFTIFFNLEIFLIYKKVLFG